MKDEKVQGYITQILNLKNPKELIEIFKELVKENPNDQELGRAVRVISYHREKES